MPPKVLIILEALFSNVGGTATIMGDPPNIIIGNNPAIAKQVSFGSFTAHILPGILLCMASVYIYIW